MVSDRFYKAKQNEDGNKFNQYTCIHMHGSLVTFSAKILVVDRPQSWNKNDFMQKEGLKELCCYQ